MSRFLSSRYGELLILLEAGGDGGMEAGVEMVATPVRRAGFSSVILLTIVVNRCAKVGCFLLSRTEHLLTHPKVGGAGRTWHWWPHLDLLLSSFYRDCQSPVGVDGDGGGGSEAPWSVLYRYVVLASSRTRDPTDHLRGQVREGRSFPSITV